MSETCCRGLRFLHELTLCTQLSDQDRARGEDFLVEIKLQISIVLNQEEKPRRFSSLRFDFEEFKPFCLLFGPRP